MLSFVTFCVQVSHLLFFRWSHWWLSVGSPYFYVLDSILKPIAGVELLKEVFTSGMRWMLLIIEWNASTNMFYLLKNLLLLILVIFKLKCNNLILNEIIVLNASYVCLYAFSLHRESPDSDPGRRTPHFWGGSVTIGRPDSAGEERGSSPASPRVERLRWAGPLRSGWVEHCRRQPEWTVLPVIYPSN
jgi:hypothetical protein